MLFRKNIKGIQPANSCFCAKISTIFLVFFRTRKVETENMAANITTPANSRTTKLGHITVINKMDGT